MATKTRIGTVGILALGLLVGGCPAPASVESAARGSGSLALSADDTRLFIADADNDELVIVDVATHVVSARVKVGKGPERVIVAPDGTVLVSNRQGRTVSVVDPAAAKELAKINVGAEPLGMSLSADGKRVLVANHTSGSVSIVDLAARKVVKTVEVTGDPSGVVALPNGRAYVTHTRSSDVTILDVDRAEVVSTAMSLQLDPSKTAGEQRLANNAADPVFNTADGRVYIPHAQSKETPVETTIENPDAYAGGRFGVPVVANALATVDTNSDTVLDAPGIEDMFQNGCFEGGCGKTTGTTTTDVPPAMMRANGPLSGASAIAIEPTGEWMFITNMNSNNVSLVPTRPREFQLEAVRVGAGPTGVAITKDSARAFVYNSFDHSVSVLEAAGKSSIVATDEFVVGATPLTPEQDLGRRLFFAADDTRMTNTSFGGIACASCHPGGRDDGRTWKFTEGLRNTPSLAGRHLRDTAPYHWDGMLNDMHAFKLVVEERMGGSGTKGGNQGSSLGTADFNAMMAFLDVQASADNPFRGAELTASQERGKFVFEQKEKANCASCHTGEFFTDNKFADVATVRSGDSFPVESKVNTPTLSGIFATAPYLHDGSAKTLRERVMTNPGDKHGKTSQLSAAEIDDLVAYLETL